jgi:GNAT superfamily N-acetyltransferase
MYFQSYGLPGEQDSSKTASKVSGVTFTTGTETAQYPNMRETIYAKFHGELVGSISCLYRWQKLVEEDDEPQASECWLSLLHVAPDFRNKGIGGDLLQKASKKMASVGCKQVEWCAGSFGSHPIPKAQLKAFYIQRGGINTDNDFFVYTIPEADRSSGCNQTQQLSALIYNQLNLFSPDAG